MAHSTVIDAVTTVRRYTMGSKGRDGQGALSHLGPAIGKLRQRPRHILPALLARHAYEGEAGTFCRGVETSTTITAPTQVPAAEPASSDLSKRQKRNITITGTVQYWYLLFLSMRGG